MIALGLVALMVFGITYAFAHDPDRGPGHRGMPWQDIKGFPIWSSLTPEQKTKFQELHQKFVDETAKLQGSILTKRLELQSLWTNPKADSKAILDKEKELRELKNQMRDKAVQSKLEARKLLTPEQISEFGLMFGMGPGFGRCGMMGRGRGMGFRGEGF